MGLVILLAGPAWAKRSMTEAEYDRKVEIAFALAKASMVVSDEDKDYDAKVEQAFAEIREAQRTEFEPTPQKLLKHAKSGFKSVINEKAEASKLATLLQNLVFYESTNEHVRVKPFFKGGSGVSLELIW